MSPNPLEYFNSIAAELRATCDRVRHLIGDAHWLSDGHHKEYVLIGVLKRHVPTGYAVGRGFVLPATADARCSKEQDILIVDTSQQRPIFDHSGLIIATPEHVHATISVKSSLDVGTIRDSLSGLSSVYAAARGAAKLGEIFSGAFFYKNSYATSSSIEKAILSEFRTTMPTSSENVDDMYDCCLATLDGCVASVGAPYSADSDLNINIKQSSLSTAVFIANLLNHLAKLRGARSSSFADFFSETTDSGVEHST